ncbi:hypothetical protein, partial [Sphingomonas sp.]|uniref:hypothetical protein n=1 Tax=Sphingomonas sp. TaxID=28214 RepID=UPI002DB7CD52
VAANLGLEFVAKRLAAVAAHLKSTKFRVVGEAVIKADGAVVFDSPNGGHWLLSKKLGTSCFEVSDPAPERAREEVHFNVCGKIPFHKGLALLPINSPLFWDDDA